MQTFEVLRHFNDVDLIKNRIFWMVKLNKSSKGMQSSFFGETTYVPFLFLFSRTRTDAKTHSTSQTHTTALKEDGVNILQAFGSRKN